MARLTYGGGNCSVDGSCRAIQIEYKGAVRMTDKTSNNFVFHLNSHRIIIYPLGQGLLANLFDYVGKFRVISAKAVDTNAEFLPITIEAQTDYAELSLTNPEDSTINIEDLNSTYISANLINRTILLSEKDNQHMANNFLNSNNMNLSGSVTASMQQASQTSSISTGTSY